MQLIVKGFVLVGLLVSAAAWGQGLSTFNGRITDLSDPMVPRALITVTEVETSVSRTTVANADGLYVVSGLRPTTYTVKVETPGFRTFRR